MKKTALILILMVAFVACKSDQKDSKTGEENVETENLSDETDNSNRYRGEFIYVADGAVLKGSNFIYGVALNEQAETLRQRVEPIKKEMYDMVPVVVKGTISKKAAGAEGWDEIITITEIVEVSNTPAEADIKIEDKKN